MPIAGYVREVEPAFREIYVPLINALVEQAKNDDQKIKGDWRPLPAAAQPHW
jgi:ribosomal 30S subunit maturation factor RimM